MVTWFLATPFQDFDLSMGTECHCPIGPLNSWLIAKKETYTEEVIKKECRLLGMGEEATYFYKKEIR